MSASDGRFEAITFDFWNTLVAEGPGSDHRTERWLAALRGHGMPVVQEELERAMTDLWTWFNGRWDGNQVVSPTDAVVQALATLGLEEDPALVRDMVETMHDGRDPNEMTVAEGIGDTLEILRAGGVKVGIICDVGLTPSTTLRRYLDHHGLLRHFDGWSFSDEVGCYKPDPVIYRHASDSLGNPDPARTAHIGDLRKTDVAGARAAGWASVRYRGFYDDGSDLPEADHVIVHHGELPSLLGVG